MTDGYFNVPGLMDNRPAFFCEKRISISARASLLFSTISTMLLLSSNLIAEDKYVFETIGNTYQASLTANGKSKDFVPHLQWIMSEPPDDNVIYRSYIDQGPIPQYVYAPIKKDGTFECQGSFSSDIGTIISYGPGSPPLHLVTFKGYGYDPAAPDHERWFEGGHNFEIDPVGPDVTSTTFDMHFDGISGGANESDLPSVSKLNEDNYAPDSNGPIMEARFFRTIIRHYWVNTLPPSTSGFYEPPQVMACDTWIGKPGGSPGWANGIAVGATPENPSGNLNIGDGVVIGDGDLLYINIPGHRFQLDLQYEASDPSQVKKDSKGIWQLPKNGKCRLWNVPTGQSNLTGRDMRSVESGGQYVPAGTYTENSPMFFTDANGDGVSDPIESRVAVFHIEPIRGGDVTFTVRVHSEWTDVAGVNHDIDTDDSVTIPFVGNDNEVLPPRPPPKGPPCKSCQEKNGERSPLIGGSNNEKGTPPEGLEVLGSSVNNITLGFLHDATDYAIGSSSGCAPCGASSGGDIGRLPRLEIARFHRYDRYESPSSLSPGIFLGTDISLVQSDDGFILNDPSMDYTLTFGGGGGSYTGGVYIESEYHAAGTLQVLDGNGVVTGNLAAAATMRVRAHDGTTYVFEPFEAAAIWYGRLVTVIDRNGNALTLSYQQPAVYEETLADGLSSERWKLHQIQDAYGRAAQFTYAAGLVAGRPMVSRIDLPNNTHLSYSATAASAASDMHLADRFDATLPDGSTVSATLSAGGSGLLAVQIDDAAANAAHGRHKALLLTGAEDVLGAFRAREVHNGAGELIYHNDVTVNDDRSREVAVIAGGNRRYSIHVDPEGMPKQVFIACGSTLVGGGGDGSEENWATSQENGEFTQHCAGAFTDSLGRETIIQRDPTTGSPVLITYPDFTTEVWTYNEFNEVLTYQDRLGRQQVCTYDTHGNLLTKTVAVGTPEEATTSYAYNARGQVLTKTDANLHTTSYHYDAAGELASVEEPADDSQHISAITAFIHDSATGRLTSSVDAHGRAVQYVYDARERQRTATYLDGSNETTDYAISGVDAGLVTLRTDRNGNRTTYGYDAAGRVVRTTQADGTSIAVDEICTYLPGTRLTTTCTRAGNTALTFYDQRNLVQSSVVAPTTGTALTSSMRYDVDGRDALTVDPFGRSTGVLFDDNDYPRRTVRELVPGGIPVDADLLSLPRILTANPPYVIEDVVYDNEGQLLRRVDARNVRTDMTYDHQGRLASVTEAVGTPDEATIRYHYDAVGNRTEVIDARGTISRSTYTARNLLESETTAAVIGIGVPTTPPAMTSYTYTETKKVATVTDPLGRVTASRYGECCDRLKEVEDPLHFIMSFSYDSVGNRTAVTDANTHTTGTLFDARNRPWKVTNAKGESTVITYSDNAASLAAAAGLGLGAGASGSAMTVTNPLGQTTVEIRDGIGRVVRRIDALGHATTFSYDALVTEAGVTLVATTAIDPLNHTVTRLTDGSGNARVLIDQIGKRTTAGFDAGGNRITWRNASDVGEDIAYDARSRPTSVTDSRAVGAGTTVTRYDGNGNVTSVTDALGHTTFTAYDGRNQRVGLTDRLQASTTFGYDVVGNLQTIVDAENGVTTYNYDARNLLTKETFPGATGGTRTYTYDPGRRLQTRTEAVTTAGGN